MTKSANTRSLEVKEVNVSGKDEKGQQLPSLATTNSSESHSKKTEIVTESKLQKNDKNKNHLSFVGKLSLETSTIVLEDQGGRIGFNSLLEMYDEYKELSLKEKRWEDLTKDQQDKREKLWKEREELAGKKGYRNAQRDDFEDAVSCNRLTVEQTKQFALLPQSYREAAFKKAFAAEAKKHEKKESLGSTCHAAIVYQNQVITANIGDGGVYTVEIDDIDNEVTVEMERSNRVIHHIGVKEEDDRVKSVLDKFNRENKSEIKVTENGYLPDSEGRGTVNTTRVFGDGNALGKSTDPDTYHHELSITKKLNFLLIGCDGIFENFSGKKREDVEHKIAQIIRDWYKWHKNKTGDLLKTGLAELAVRINNYAKESGSGDNRSLTLTPFIENSTQAEVVISADGHGGKTVSEAVVSGFGGLFSELVKALDEQFKLLGNPTFSPQIWSDIEQELAKPTELLPEKKAEPTQKESPQFLSYEKLNDAELQCLCKTIKLISLAAENRAIKIKQQDLPALLYLVAVAKTKEESQAQADKTFVSQANDLLLHFCINCYTALKANEQGSHKKNLTLILKNYSSELAQACSKNKENGDNFIKQLLNVVKNNLSDDELAAGFEKFLEASQVWPIQSISLEQYLGVLSKYNNAKFPINKPNRIETQKFGFSDLNTEGRKFLFEVNNVFSLVTKNSAKEIKPEDFSALLYLLQVADSKGENPHLDNALIQFCANAQLKNSHASSTISDAVDTASLTTNAKNAERDLKFVFKNYGHKIVAAFLKNPSKENANVFIGYLLYVSEAYKEGASEARIKTVFDEVAKQLPSSSLSANANLDEFIQDAQEKQKSKQYSTKQLSNLRSLERVATRLKDVLESNSKFEFSTKFEVVNKNSDKEKLDESGKPGTVRLVQVTKVYEEKESQNKERKESNISFSKCVENETLDDSKYNDVLKQLIPDSEPAHNDLRHLITTQFHSDKFSLEPYVSFSKVLQKEKIGFTALKDQKKNDTQLEIIRETSGKISSLSTKRKYIFSKLDGSILSPQEEEKALAERSVHDAEITVELIPQYSSDGKNVVAVKTVVSQELTESGLEKQRDFGQSLRYRTDASEIEARKQRTKLVVADARASMLKNRREVLRAKFEHEDVELTYKVIISSSIQHALQILQVMIEDLKRTRDFIQKQDQSAVSEANNFLQRVEKIYQNANTAKDDQAKAIILSQWTSKDDATLATIYEKAMILAKEHGYYHPDEKNPSHHFLAIHNSHKTSDKTSKNGLHQLDNTFLADDAPVDTFISEFFALKVKKAKINEQYNIMDGRLTGVVRNQALDNALGEFEIAEKKKELFQQSPMLAIALLMSWRSTFFKDRTDFQPALYGLLTPEQIKEVSVEVGSSLERERFCCSGKFTFSVMDEKSYLDIKAKGRIPTDSYFFVKKESLKESYVVYFKADEVFDNVKIDDINKFEKDCATLMKDDKNKVLDANQINELVTLNGGHTPRKMTAENGDAYLRVQSLTHPEKFLPFHSYIDYQDGRKIYEPIRNAGKNQAAFDVLDKKLCDYHENRFAWDAKERFNNANEILQTIQFCEKDPAVCMTINSMPEAQTYKNELSKFKKNVEKELELVSVCAAQPADDIIPKTTKETAPRPTALGVLQRPRQLSWWEKIWNGIKSIGLVIVSAVSTVVGAFFIKQAVKEHKIQAEITEKSQTKEQVEAALVGIRTGYTYPSVEEISIMQSVFPQTPKAAPVSISKPNEQKKEKENEKNNEQEIVFTTLTPVKSSTSNTPQLSTEPVSSDLNSNKNNNSSSHATDDEKQKEWAKRAADQVQQTSETSSSSTGNKPDSTARVFIKLSSSSEAEHLEKKKDKSSEADHLEDEENNVEKTDPPTPPSTDSFEDGVTLQGGKIHPVVPCVLDNSNITNTNKSTSILNDATTVVVKNDSPTIKL